MFKILLVVFLLILGVVGYKTYRSDDDMQSSAVVVNWSMENVPVTITHKKEEMLDVVVNKVKKLSPNKIENPKMMDRKLEKVLHEEINPSEVYERLKPENYEELQTVANIAIEEIEELADKYREEMMIEE